MIPLYAVCFEESIVKQMLISACQKSNKTTVNLLRAIA